MLIMYRQWTWFHLRAKAKAGGDVCSETCLDPPAIPAATLNPTCLFSHPSLLTRYSLLSPIHSSNRLCRGHLLFPRPCLGHPFYPWPLHWPRGPWWDISSTVRPSHLSIGGREQKRRDKLPLYTSIETDWQSFLRGRQNQSQIPQHPPTSVTPTSVAVPRRLDRPLPTHGLRGLSRHHIH